MVPWLDRDAPGRAVRATPSVPQGRMKAASFSFRGVRAVNLGIPRRSGSSPAIALLSGAALTSIFAYAPKQTSTSGRCVLSGR